ncbi:sigma-70 family RNA polymerase sigma factor [Chitinophaga arvensicola]|uniref:RNA polymerase sigma-70 factor, ECF subfamily n=1 Tax=Chitinophaga arvensicola TaxID=29529 RepID=A0A1I0S9N6_9BACT|nr:sigma-70 family RNA polymerase sigma factor [Chitinophaga arvensicola]SEW52753.1 RNA polymerase sigma-70 factor, ECF subfamily [Chitinophaga arvensicola]
MPAISHTDFHAGEIDEQSFKQLFHQYWHSVFSVCLKYTGSAEDSRELAQDIFFSLWRRRHQLDVKTNISTYLHGAARLKSFEFMRNASRLKERSAGGPPPDTAAGDAAMILEHKELHDQLQHFIDHLPEPGQKIFRLSREQGLTHKEIAADTGISVGMVEYYIGTALRTLRNKLKLT